MSTISPPASLTSLDRLRIRIEVEVQRRLIERILDLGVVYHARRGLRPGCTCEFCVAKRKATNDIGNMSFQRFSSREEVDYFREMKRIKHRRILRDLVV